MLSFFRLSLNFSSFMNSLSKCDSSPSPSDDPDRQTLEPSRCLEPGLKKVKASKNSKIAYLLIWRMVFCLSVMITIVVFLNLPMRTLFRLPFPSSSCSDIPQFSSHFLHTFGTLNTLAISLLPFSIKITSSFSLKWWWMWVTKPLFYPSKPLRPPSLGQFYLPLRPGFPGSHNQVDVLV